MDAAVSTHRAAVLQVDAGQAVSALCWHTAAGLAGILFLSTGWFARRLESSEDKRVRSSRCYLPPFLYLVALLISVSFALLCDMIDSQPLASSHSCALGIWIVACRCLEVLMIHSSFSWSHRYPPPLPDRSFSSRYVEAPDTDGVDDDTAAEAAWEHFKLRNQSVIVDLFMGMFKSTISCQSCGHCSNTFEPFTFLSLPLLGSQNSSVTLDQCLKAFARSESMTGSDRWHCPKCKRDRDATKTIFIWRLPRVLIVHLKRFFFEGPFRAKLETYVDFPLDNLDMSNHCRGKVGFCDRLLCPRCVWVAFS